LIAIDKEMRAMKTTLRILIVLRIVELAKIFRKKWK
jgi:hypothetical protein